MSVERFVKAQEQDFNIALNEVENGRKQSHWIWYIFPQLVGLGKSNNSNHYGIRDLEEASIFLSHPILGKNLREITSALLTIEGKSALEIFGDTDSKKVKSCMTLFDLADGITNNVFSQVLNKYYEGKQDETSLALLRKPIVLVAGASGKLGIKIVNELVKKDVAVRALMRENGNSDKIEFFKSIGVDVCLIDTWTIDELKKYCKDATCVVSALAGLREVVIDAQKILLDAAIAAGVPRFIPSDYSLDFTKFKYGENRNLDWRREFHEYLDKQPIIATSIFNGAFMELLLDEMPMIIFKKKLVVYWGNANYKWGFTTMDNTAAYTAHVAIDASSPRYLHIAGDIISPIEVRTVVSEVFGTKFRLVRAGGKGFLGFLIKMIRRFSPSTNELYPAWQGMQYMHNMIDERSKIHRLTNDRYVGIKWTTVKDILSGFKQQININ